MSLTDLPAVELCRMLGSATLSAETLMQETMARIGAANPLLNAIVALRDPEALLAEARAADAVATEVRGPLHGLPFAVKDLEEVAGIRSTQGSPIFADRIPDADGALAARLRAAGAILIGKTNTPELGLGSHSYNPVHGVTGNPYDPDLSAGGSSGGAAAALAAGMVALADGSDMMGSLRNPAGWCNVYGFRPSWGLVPPGPVGEMFLHQLSTLGPMARSPGDLALLLDVMAVPEPRHPHSRPPAAPFAPPRPAEPAGLRIGWLGDWGGALPMEPGVLETCAAALEQMAGLGCEVEDVPPPFDAEAMWTSWTCLRSWAVAASLAPLARRRDEMKPAAQWELARGEALGAMEVQRASEIRSDWFRAACDLFERYDALALPTAQCWPFDRHLDWPKQIAGREMDSYHRWMQVVVPASLIGLPALSVPAGFGAAGLPMGLQLIGPRGADARLLALGEAWHLATRWPARRPPPAAAPGGEEEETQHEDA